MTRCILDTMLRVKNTENTGYPQAEEHIYEQLFLCANVFAGSTR